MSKYDDDKVQFANRFYLQTRAKVNQNDNEDVNFSTIQTLYIVIGIMQLFIMPLFGILGGWSSVTVKKIVKDYIENHDTYKTLLSKFNCIEVYSKIVILGFIMFIFIPAMVELHNYCEETFNSNTIATIHVVFLSSPHCQ